MQHGGSDKRLHVQLPIKHVQLEFQSMVETINKLTRIQRQLVQEFDRDPTAEEISEVMGDGMTPERVREIQKIALVPVSLETPIEKKMTHNSETSSKIKLRFHQLNMQTISY